jgi:HSP20 family molecular chaperone IbpA
MEKATPKKEDTLIPFELFTLGFKGGPFADMRRFPTRWIVFDEFGVPSGRFPPISEIAPTWYPNLELLHKNENLVVRVELPGINKDAVQIDITDGSVRVFVCRAR